MEIDKILSGMKIIDLRENVSLNNSLNVSMEKLIIYPAKYLNKENKYLLVCDKGIKSLKTSKILNKMGYQTYSLKGGINSKNI